MNGGGCGGNRDTSKRSKMAQIAEKYSDYIILTSDNPRFEEPEAILTEMKAGLGVLGRGKSTTITDRKAAIQHNVASAQKDDLILVEGKGHETYQEIKGERFPFDDREVLRKAFEEEAY